MKCQKCGSFDATTHITEIVNGVKSESWLCSKCANAVDGNFSFESLFHPDFDNFFGSVLNQQKFLDTSALKQCPICKSTLSDIKKSGRLGCSECYSVFYDFLIKPLKEIQGSTKHIGKIPGSAKSNKPGECEIQKLKDLLDEAVQKQEFEKAAELRDRIKLLEKGEKEA
ncbi:MAG: UvrB/UvrC motif-containing protein [Clostridia bacterium]|nr:UvrB/UvrC motif-containing protein [Clostridia bacterium]